MSELADRLRDEREKKIDDMLTHYTDAMDTLYSGALGSGDGPTRMPLIWRRSGYPTLESLLKAMRLGAASLDGPVLYGHVRAFYFQCQRVRKPVMRRDKKGRETQAFQHGERQWRIEVVPAQHDPGKVMLALGWLASSWPERAPYGPERYLEIVSRLERARQKAVAA